jgi:hypothetical protein
MTRQYLDTLRQVGTSPSTKFIVPVELVGLLGGLLGPPGRDGGESARS